VTYNCSIVYIVREFEIVLSPLNSNNLTLKYKKYDVERNKVRGHCGDNGGFNASESSRVTGISALRVKAWYGLEYKRKRCYTGVGILHFVSVLYNLIFIAYRYHELDNHACHQTLKILVTLCL